MSSGSGTLLDCVGCRFTSLRWLAVCRERASGSSFGRRFDASGLHNSLWRDDLPYASGTLAKPDYKPTRYQEAALWRAGFSAVAGLDEVGRGALAGPVAAGAVILPPARRLSWLSGLRDSKQLTPQRREELAPRIKQTALAWGIGWADAQEIDALGILPATRLAMRRALAACGVPPDYALIDGRDRHDFGLPCRVLTRGDERVASIAAASVIAKVFRDGWMRDLDILHHGYRFADNKGYATSAHRAALWHIGPCLHHRFSYEPVRSAADVALGWCRPTRRANGPNMP